MNNDSQLNFITDMVGYNRYSGWYEGEMEDYQLPHLVFRVLVEPVVVVRDGQQGDLRPNHESRPVAQVRNP